MKFLYKKCVYICVICIYVDITNANIQTCRIFSTFNRQWNRSAICRTGTNTAREKARKVKFEAVEDEEVGRTTSIEERRFC